MTPRTPAGCRSSALRRLEPDAAGVPGTAEPGDRMGASFAAKIIGVPGEDDARGAVISALPVDGDSTVRWYGTGSAGARYGAAVAP